MEPSSIESRTRASFARVKRDIDALKRQIAKLRERDEKLDHALSDYARTGELYERVKAIDERFATLPDSYPTAQEFERAIERLVKGLGAISKRLKDVERRDSTSEIGALRRDLESLDRKFVPKADYDAFADKASRRVAKLDESVVKLDAGIKRLDAVEKRLDALKGVEDAHAQLKEQAKVIKRLDGADAKATAKRLDALEKNVDPVRFKEFDKRLAKLEQHLDGADTKAFAKRLDALESAQLSADALKAEIDASLSDVVRVPELNEKIDEFNVALESVADADRLAQIEASLAELRESPAPDAGIDERLVDLERRLETERHATNAEVSVASEQLETLSEKLSALESDLGKRLGALEASLGSERHATNAEVSAAADQIDEIAMRLDRVEVSLENVRSAGSEGSSSSEELATVRERLADLEAQNSAVLSELAEVQGGVDSRFIEEISRDLGLLKTRVEELADDVSLYAKSSTKNAERSASVEHLAEELEFLRSNVAMQADLESVRGELASAGTSAKKGGKPDSRVEVLSEDLQRLIERQSELEKKVINLETQGRAARERAETPSEDPLWNGKGKGKAAKSSEPAEKTKATIAEKVPLREAKKKPEPKPAPQKEPAREEKKPASEEKDGKRKGPMGRMRGWVVDFFTEEVEDDEKDELY